MMKYKHVFFDLDHTLWDFEANSREALHEIFTAQNIQHLLSCTFEQFLEVYYSINNNFWELYKQGKVSREKLRDGRFIETFKLFKYHHTELPKQISNSYLKISPYKKQLFDGAFAVLNYLQNKGYNLHIITNGFNEVQYIKLHESGLLPYFTSITTSEIAGENKPHLAIFDYALNLAKATANNSIMIGDNFEADIEGAVKAGLDAIWFNPGKITQQSSLRFTTIHHLGEIEKCL